MDLISVSGISLQCPDQGGHRWCGCGAEPRADESKKWHCARTSCCRALQGTIEEIYNISSPTKINTSRNDALWPNSMRAVNVYDDQKIRRKGEHRAMVVYFKTKTVGRLTMSLFLLRENRITILMLVSMFFYYFLFLLSPLSYFSPSSSSSSSLLS